VGLTLSEFSPVKQKTFCGVCINLQTAKPNLQLFAINFQNINTGLGSIGQVGGANFTVMILYKYITKHNIVC